MASGVAGVKRAIFHWYDTNILRFELLFPIFYDILYANLRANVHCLTITAQVFFLFYFSIPMQRAIVTI